VQRSENEFDLHRRVVVLWGLENSLVPHSHDVLFVSLFNESSCFKKEVSPVMMAHVQSVSNIFLTGSGGYVACPRSAAGSQPVY
jgi:hypothetical protein